VLLERYNQQIKIGALGKGNKKQIHYKSFNHAKKKKKIQSTKPQGLFPKKNQSINF
jgi:hypothetical protein